MSTAKEPCRPRLTSGGRDEPLGGRWPGARGRRTVLLRHYFLGRRRRQDSKASLPAPRFPTGKMVTAKGRQFRWLGPGKRSAEAPVRTWVITVSASGTMGPSRCRWRCAWPHPVLTMTGEARHLHEPVGKRGSRGAKRLDGFPKVTQLIGGEWRSQPKPRGLQLRVGGSAAPTPPPRRRGAERLGRWSPRPAAEGRAAHTPQVLGRDGDDHTARGAASGSLSCSPGCGQVQRLAAQLPRADPPRERPRPPLFKGQQREEQATSPVASPRSAIGGVWVPGTVLGAGSRWRARWTQSL